MHILGFSSFSDFIKTTFIGKNITLNIIFALFTTINTFITSYIYDDAKAVYFLMFLIGIDFLTGVWKSLKQKTFSSAKFFRAFITLLVYVLVLSISWNSAKFSVFFLWLPSVVYGGMIGTLIVSVIENIYILGYLPKKLVEKIKDRILKK